MTGDRVRAAFNRTEAHATSLRTPEFIQLTTTPAQDDVLTSYSRAGTEEAKAQRVPICPADAAMLLASATMSRLRGRAASTLAKPFA
jgi:hypothetical protein